MGVLAGWISSYSNWILQFGAIGWVFSGLMATLSILAIFALVFWCRFQWIRGRVIAEWRNRVDSIDPMADTYSKKRIKIADIVDPITNSIEGKTFTDCDLIGPANLIFLNNNSFNGCAFVDCDAVPLKHDGMLLNAVAIVKVNVVRGRIANCTLFVPPPLVPIFRKMGIGFTSLAIDEPQPNQPLQSTGAEVQK